VTPRLLLILLAAGCVDLEHEEVGTTTGEVSVTWTNLVGVTASGSDLTKTASTSEWDAGAVSVETLAGDGYVEFTVGETGTNKAAGLSNGDGGQHYSDIDFALRFATGGGVQVREAGVLRGSFGTYAAGDRFRVEVKGGVVSYSRSGAAPFYTSALAPSFPLGVDTSFYTPGATINDVELVATALTWQNVVGVEVSGDSLTKTDNTTGWTAGASSVQTLTGDGFVEFAVADNTTAKAAGLSSGDSDQSYTDIDYGLRLNANGIVYVWEAGVLRGNFGSYLAGDRFRVEVSAGVVSYSMNGGLPFYTSAVAPNFPLLVDTAFSTPGATLNDLALAEAASACPAYDGTGLVCDGTFIVNNSFDLQQIASCANITGNLTIQAPGMTEIALPLLERIGGNLTITGNTDMARLRLPALKEIGGATVLEALAATGGVDLSHLRTAGGLDTRMYGSLEMNLPCLDTSGTLRAVEWNGSALVSAPLHVSRLRQVVGSITAGDLAVPGLTSVAGDVTSSVSLDAPGLTDIAGTLEYGADDNVAALERVGGLILRDVPTVDLPALVEIAGALGGGGASLCNSEATVVDLPALERAGSIHLCWSALQQISLPQLQTITGPPAAGYSLFLVASVIGPVDFPSLTTVRGKSYMSMAGANFPVLDQVRGGLIASQPLSVPVLTEVTATMLLREGVGTMNAPSLMRVGKDLNLYVPFSADNLTEVGGVLRPRVGDFSLPSLASVGGVVVRQEQAILSLHLPALTQVLAASLSNVAGDVAITSNPALTSVSMPLLQSIAGDLNVAKNDDLTSLDFASLTALGPLLAINRNLDLPNCYATNIHDQLVANGWTGIVDIRRNNGTGTCP
jgi:hypothetical protein